MDRDRTIEYKANIKKRKKKTSSKSRQKQNEINISRRGTYSRQTHAGSQ
jgi:hypothetical protein